MTLKLFINTNNSVFCGRCSCRGALSKAVLSGPLFLIQIKYYKYSTYNRTIYCLPEQLAISA